MANLQYIGPRVVPKPYRNPDTDNAEWKSGIEYEALTMVTYLSNGYVSAKPVPSSVGNPADNPDYWVESADFDAALSDLQIRVSDLEDDVLNLQGRTWLYGKKIVAYGDSTICANEGGTGESYLERACRLGGATLTNRAVAGTKMSDGINNGVSLINAATDIPSYDYVILAYGTNEWTTQLTYDEIVTSVINIRNAVISKNATAQIIFLLAPHSHHDWENGYGVNHNSQNYTLEDVQDIIIKKLNDYNIRFIDLNKRSSCNDDNYTVLMESSGWGVHPKPVFRVELAGIVLQGPNVEKVKYYVPIIDNLDFVAARADDKSLYPGYWYGYALNIASSVTSSKKFFRNGFPIRFVGEVVNDGEASIQITNGPVYTVKGKFDITIDPTFSVGIITISGDNIQITNFMAYGVYDYPILNSYTYMFGASFKCTNGTPVATDLYVSRVKHGIQIVANQITMNAGTYSSGTALYTLPSGISLDFATYTVFDTQGNTYNIFTNGSSIKFAKSYTFDGTEKLIFEPRQLLNAAYPNAHYTPT